MVLTRLPIEFPVITSAILSSSTLYAAAPDCSIRELDITDFEALSTIPERLSLPGHGGQIARLAVSNNQQYLAAASLDGRVRIHHPSTIRRIAALPLANLPTGPTCTGMAPIPMGPVQVNQKQADTARTARDAAQQQLLDAAILRIQTLMEAMSQACPGGARGVSPVNWSSLQRYGNTAVSFLNAAKLALGRGQTSDAVEQINSAEGQLEVLVKGLSKSCSGGGSGVDPIGYNGFMSSTVALKGSMDGIKRNLEN
jgi:hypothetical protein